MSWINIVECLQCSNRYEEKNKDFVEVCPFCGNDDVLKICQRNVRSKY